MACYLKAVEWNPDHAEAHYRAGVILNGNRQFKEAIRSRGDTGWFATVFAPVRSQTAFEETLERAPNEVRAEDVPDNIDEVAARYVAVAPRYGLEFV